MYPCLKSVFQVVLFTVQHCVCGQRYNCICLACGSAFEICCCTCSQQARQLHLHFLRSPREIKDSGAGHVAGLELETNALQTNSDQTSQTAVGTGQMQSLTAQLVLESIGYKSHPIEGAPFDDRRGIIPNK